MMAALMEAELDRSPSPDDRSDDHALVDDHLLAEERELHKMRLAADVPVVEERPQSEVEGGAGKVLEELIEKSQLYSGFLFERFTDLIKEMMTELEAKEPELPEERPAKRSRAARGNNTATPAVTPTATQRLLPLIKADLRKYQLMGVAWLVSLYKNGVNGILADEMGLGKTLQTISFISFLWSHSRDTKGKYLVVGPLSTLSNWVGEFAKFCPSIPVLLYHGTPGEREKLRREHMTGDKQMPVIVTSYEIIIADRSHLAEHTWKLLVVDEGHRLKNYECKLLRELRALNTQARLLLTGTPLQNNLKELWSLLSFCMPQVFTDSEQFLDWFDIRTPETAIPSALMAPGGAAAASRAAAAPAKKRRGGRKPKAVKKETEAAAAAAGSGEEEARQSGGESGEASAEGEGKPNKAEAAATMISRLHAILKPFVLRRLKADVDIGVPPKQEIVLYADMTEHQKKLIRGLLDGTLQDELAKEAGAGVRMRSLNNLLMQLRKVCNHPDLITGAVSGVTTYPPAEELLEQCGKLALLDRLLKQLLGKGHKVLIFSQMTEMLNVIEAYLQDLGHEAFRIDGSVPWQERKEAIAEFQNEKSDKKIFLLSTRAGGLGITLTAADTVIIYDSDWNPHQDSQAMDRCHRIGQTKPVLVFRLVTANSVENRMLAKADSKKALERIVIKKGAFKELLQATTSTSVDELVQLLNPDRRSGDLAQSGVVSDEALARLLDRTHLVKAFQADQKARAERKAKAASGAGGSGGDSAEGLSAAPPLPPYPLVGVGYEVVVDEPRKAGELLQ